MEKQRIRKGDNEPDITHEQSLIDVYGTPVCGIDEAGRGPWAGPVVAAAVILDLQHIPSGLKDSKLLTASKRDAIFDDIMSHALVGIGIGSVELIDRDNILQATFQAMREAVSRLALAPVAALVDGNQSPSLPYPARLLVGGDRLSCSIAAASIIAKVTRDRIMIKLSADFPNYGWECNKGYGTSQHRHGLHLSGVTLHHRRSFAPIRALLSDL